MSYYDWDSLDGYDPLPTTFWGFLYKSLRLLVFGLIFMVCFLMCAAVVLTALKTCCGQ